jgi:hypothetical protein
MKSKYFSSIFADDAIAYLIISQDSAVTRVQYLVRQLLRFSKNNVEDLF